MTPYAQLGLLVNQLHAGARAADEIGLTSVAADLRQEADKIDQIVSQHRRDLALKFAPPHEHRFFTTGGAWRCCDCGATKPRIVGPGV